MIEPHTAGDIQSYFFFYRSEWMSGVAQRFCLCAIFYFCFLNELNDYIIGLYEFSVTPKFKYAARKRDAENCMRFRKTTNFFYKSYNDYRIRIICESFFLSEWALSFRIDPLWNGDCHRQYWNNWLNWPIVMKYRLSNERKLRTDLNAEVASSVCSQLRQLNALSCWNLLISYSIGSSELVSKDSISKIANKLQQCHYKWNPFLRTGDILGDISMWNMLKLTCLLLPAINLPIA